LIRRIDRYELLEQVGTGGMSVVYRGRDTALDREVAVKILHPHLATKAESRARFSREARAVARLSHPGIVEIFDYSGDATEESWLVTEFVHGRTLRAFADEVGIPLPECGALVGVALADALVHAHAAGVIHRDLKPENVLIAESGGRPAVKLADFGIARILSQDDRMTMTGALVGSPNHMAPEIVEGAEADERSDVFSLGTILYWLCTGRFPFEAPNPTATLRRLVTGDFVEPRQANPALCEPLARIIRATLAHAPDARPASAGAVRDQLVLALRDDGVDRPDETLMAFLSDPSATAAALRPRLVEVRLRRGEELLARGETALALDAFDGVLALEPRHPAVLRHLEAIARRDRTRRRLRLAAAALGAVTALGLAGLAAVHLAGGPGPGAGSASTPGQPGTEASGTTTGSIPGTGAAAVAGPEGASAPAASLPVAAPAGAEARPPSDLPRAAARTAAAAVVPFTVHVRPYAQRALLDGVEVAAGQQQVVFSLAPGVHRLRIEHPCCEPFEREIDAATAARTGELRIPLVPRPASLRVSGDPSTRVFLDGKLLGTAGESQREPFRVPVPSDGSSPYEGEGDLRLEPPGRPVAIAPVRIRAGQDITVPVVQSEEPPR
jgi:tRNA A-37 threonylcarbamoyl transferase component Bud32